MKSQLTLIIENLIESFDGKPWYGAAVMTKLEAISWNTTNEKKYDEKSIAVLLKHMINWRIFVLKKLQGDASFEIEMDSVTDWTPVQIESEQAWKALQQEAVETQTEILSILNTLDDTILSEQVPGKDYTFKPLLTSIAQHDIYHLGQIAMLNAAQNS